MTPLFSTTGRLLCAAVVVVCLAGDRASGALRQDLPAPASTAPATQRAAGANGAARAEGGETPPQAVVVTYVEGKARARATPDAEWQVLEVGMRLPQGAEIQTGARSRVICAVPPGREFAVDRLSTVTVLAAEQRGNRATTDLLMEYGRTDLRVQAAGLEHDARVRTPGYTASVRGTEYSIYNQPPFAPELRTFTGIVDYRFAKRRLSVAAGGASRGGRGAAETALLQTVVDPNIERARTNADAALIAQETSRGAVVTYDPDIRLAEIRGGAGPQTTGQLQQSLPGKLNFVVRWNGNVDMDIFVTVQPGDPTETFISGVFQPQTILYPGFGLELAPSGGRIPYNHRGGPNGGQEICFWPEEFPTAVYGFSAVSNSESNSADVRFNAFLDGRKLSLYTFDIDGNLIRAKGIQRTVAPQGSESTIVAVPPSGLFELILPESPDETLDGTELPEPPGGEPPPFEFPPLPKGDGGATEGTKVASAKSAGVRPARPHSDKAARRAEARRQASAAKAARVAAAREAKATRASRTPKPAVVKPAARPAAVAKRR